MSRLAQVLRLRSDGGVARGSGDAAFHTVIVKPVGNLCNLRCTYCFNFPEQAARDHKNTPSLMSDEILRKTIAEALSAGPQFLQFVWHGGEPLLAGIEFFEKAMSIQCELNTEGRTIQNAVQTNGTLIDDAWAGFFEKHDFGVSISVDGPEAIHDVNRIYASGKGSFQQVREAIERVNQRGVVVGSVMVRTRGSTLSAHDCLALFASLGLKGFTVSPCCTTDDRAILPQEWSRFVIELFEEWLLQDASELQINPLEDVVGGLLGHAPKTCWMAGECNQYVSVEMNGEVWPCCDRSVPPKYKLGNIEHEGLGTILARRDSEALKLSDDLLPDGCAACEWVDLCHGGCVHHRIIQGGASDVKDHLCSGYIEIYSHISARIEEILGRTRQQPGSIRGRHQHLLSVSPSTTP